MAQEEGFITLLITTITVFISLFIPLPIKEEYRLIVIAGIILLFIGANLSSFNKMLKEQSFVQKRLEDKLKIHEQLIDIKKDLTMLKEDRSRK